MFGNLEAVGPAAAADAADQRISQAMLHAWVAFARSGDPNAAGSHAWPPYAREEDNFIVFGDAVSTGRAWRQEQLEFLDRFFSRDHRSPA